LGRLLGQYEIAVVCTFSLLTHLKEISIASTFYQCVEESKFGEAEGRPLSLTEIFPSSYIFIANISYLWKSKFRNAMF
jgi:hypothetical protein